MSQPNQRQCTVGLMPRTTILSLKAPCPNFWRLKGLSGRDREKTAQCAGENSMITKTFVDCDLRWPDQKKTELDFEIWMTIYDGEDLLGEFGMEWFALGADYAPRLECFHDAFIALKESGIIPDLYELGGREGFSPDAFKGFLLAHGFVDETLKGRE